MYDLIIVGAGPAGLAAALFAKRKRLKYLVLTGNLGGKSNQRVELPEADEDHIVSARELVTVYRSRLEYLRHSYRLECVTKIEAADFGFRVTTNRDRIDEARAVLVATGTRVEPLGVEGEQQYRLKGLGYSAISYSDALEGKRVFLAGNTSRVLNSALELSVHAAHVTAALLKDGGFDEQLREHVSGLDRVLIIPDAEIQQFRGGEFASEVVVDGSGNQQTIQADGFFVEPEPIPNTEFLHGLVELSPSGHIPVDSSNMTKTEGLFAAGDVTGNGFEQILVALGEGAKAALSAYRYLLRHSSLTGG
jgi:alkyl hydroperoxide reductase subunit F